jgi:hypothetical protein
MLNFLFLASKAHSILKPFELAMHMLCQHIQVIIEPNMWHDEIFIFLSKILYLPFDISKAIFAYIFVLNCIRLYKIPMCFLSWQLIFLIFEKKSRTMATLDK